MVAVRNAETINIIVYIDSEKYQFAEIRDDYMQNIRHMVEGLEVRCQMCRNLQEFKRRMDKEIYTHAFITIDEYREDKDYLTRFPSNWLWLCCRTGKPLKYLVETLKWFISHTMCSPLPVY